MDVTRDQYEFAAAIAQRNREKNRCYQLPERERETQLLFYWCMTQMARKVEKNLTSKNHQLSLVSDGTDTSGYWTVYFFDSYYEDDRYQSNTTSNRFVIMKEVADIINSLPDFTALYTADNYRAFLRIFMDASKD